MYSQIAPYKTVWFYFTEKKFKFASVMSTDVSIFIRDHCLFFYCWYSLSNLIFPLLKCLTSGVLWISVMKNCVQGSCKKTLQSRRCLPSIWAEGFLVSEWNLIHQWSSKTFFLFVLKICFGINRSRSYHLKKLDHL